MLARAFDKLVSAPILRLFALAGVVGWSVAFLAHAVTLRNPLQSDGRPVGGDFVSFYAAGQLVMQGAGRQLYDARSQWRAQREALRAPEYPNFCPFPYPPTLAVAEAPLSLLPFVPAYLAHVGLCLAAILAGLRLLRPALRRLAPFWGTAASLAALFYPLTVSVTCGQNTAFSFLLMCAFFAGLRSQRDLRAGIALGLLAFKPQMALLLGLAMVAAGRWRVVGAAAAVGVGHYVLGAIVVGPDWPARMLALLDAFWELNTAQHTSLSISLPAVLHGLSPAALRNVLLLGVCGLLCLSCVVGWRGAAPGGGISGPLAMTVSATLLIGPHALWYDTGLLSLAGLLIANDALARGGPFPAWLKGALTGVFVLGPTFHAAAGLGVQPLLAAPAALFLIAALAQARRGASAPARRETWKAHLE